MGLVDVILEHFIRLVVFLMKSVAQSLKTPGARTWPCAEATVTDEPVVLRTLGCPTVEIVYSYRVEGELYTGLHEEPFLLADSLTDFVGRCSKGQSFLVRYKPGKPEISAVRQQDQAMQFAHS